jgi:hypothetical protein
LAHISESAPLQISRFYTGWYSYRNPLIVPIRQFGRRIIELYDAISDGLNMEPSNRLTLKRRPGYTAFNTLAINSGIPLWFYSFKPTDFPGQIYLVVDTETEVQWILPGSVVPVTLVGKTVPTLSNFAQVAAYMYISNDGSFTLPSGEMLTSEIKWDGPLGAQGITKWGIDIATNLAGAAAGAHGPLPHTAQTNIPLSQPAPAWLNNSVTIPGNAPIEASQYLAMWGYGVNIVPSVTQTNIEVVGIEVKITGVETQGEGIRLQVALMKLNSPGRTFLTGSLPANSGVLNLGGRSELWGQSWTIDDVNNFEFGVAIQAVNQSGESATFTIQEAAVTVWTAAGPDVDFWNSVPGGNGLDAQVGYQYKYAYGNSYSGHISSPTPASIFGTDPTNPQIKPGPTQGVVVHLIGSDDPQVNQIHVYRTTDGGGQPFFELPNSPFPNTGSSTTPQDIYDNSPDYLLQIASICPDPHFNDPPPVQMLDPVWFGGRLWGHRQNQLFFASGPDITVGNEAESWFPVYVFALPNIIVRKYPTPNGMLVVTNDEIYIVRGISTASFTVNEFMRDTGQRVWTAGDSDGTNIYILTSDRQLILINANGMNSVSANIADRIQVVDPTRAYVSIYRYTALENWLFVSDGSEFIYPFNVELQAWAVRQQPIGGVNAIATVETSPGVWQFWRGKPVNGETITYRNPNVWADEGAPYPCHAIFGPIPIADFLTLAQIRDIAYAYAATDSGTVLSVLANEIYPMNEKQYEIIQISSPEPPELSATPSISYHANRWTWKTCPLPEDINFFFHRFDYSASPNPDEIYVWCAGGSQTTGGSTLSPGQLPQLQGR